MRPKLCALFALLSLTGCGLELGYPGDGKPVANDGKLRIFVLGNVTGDMNGKKGIAGADQLCNSSAAKPVEGTYRALIVDGTDRVAKPGSQVAWVLKPETKYYRANGTTLIGETTSQAIFPFPLQAAPQLSGTYAWTGLETDWERADDHCALWTSTSSTTVKGRVGQSTATTAEALAQTERVCSGVASLYCVQQP